MGLSSGPHIELELEAAPDPRLEEPELRFVSIRVKPGFKSTLQQEAELNHRSLQNEVIEMLRESLRRRERRRTRQGTAA